tara:strand:+ start:6546 stop:6773 length:228 start_codon:yes stop_codon:yes gene_type:complete
MDWDDVAEPFIFVEGDIVSYATNEGIYVSVEIVRISCPYCGERFIGNKAHAGQFILGHTTYHEYIIDRVEKFGGI